jgi:hypothetical protein
MHVRCVELLNLKEGKRVRCVELLNLKEGKRVTCTSSRTSFQRTQLRGSSGPSRVEAVLMFPGRHLNCIISIGTGHARTIKIPPPTWLQQRLPLDVVRAMQGIAMNCERNAQDMMRRFQNTQNCYFRFNVEQGLQEVRLDQWERLDEVTAHTGQYMGQVEVDQKLGAAVIAVQEKLNRVLPEQIGMTLAPMSVLVII